MMNIVLDTNCLLMSLSRRSPYYPIWHDLLSGKYVLCYTTDILLEYEEILTQKMGPEIASHVISALLNLPNSRAVQIYFHLQLITQDPDDNKFVDCAFKANARYIVTQDHHYDVLRDMDSFQLDVIGIDEFLRVLGH